MKDFLCPNFLLTTDIAEYLYHEIAAPLPILDYHCHLPPEHVSGDYQFKNLTDIWLSGDHYKWRVMRSNGVEERLCTGDAPDKEKFLAFAKTVPTTIGNPIFHWTHLELKRAFGITDAALSEKNATSIWAQCNEMLSTPEFSARSIMKAMNVEMVGTTDDPIDDLSAHEIVASDLNFTIKMLPSWRPDKVTNIQLDAFVDYIRQLSSITDANINTFDDLCSALATRLDYFSKRGCCIADHALDTVVYSEATEKELSTILMKRLTGLNLSDLEVAQFKTGLLLSLGREYAQRNWVQQYHIGALRDNNERMFHLLGADAGFDSIDDKLIAGPLARLLNALDRERSLPKTILYCLNPCANEVLATMCGNFCEERVPGKVQFGSGWWFNDQKDGMKRQMTQLAQLGLISRFIGMTTDSRSFLSYTRHEYFRRILCEMIGGWVARGEAPNDTELLSKLVSDICYHNAKSYFQLKDNAETSPS